MGYHGVRILHGWQSTNPAARQALICIAGRRQAPEKPRRHVRILFSSQSYMPLLGGTERFSHRLARKLKSRGHLVEVLTGARKGCPAYEEIDDIPIHRAYWTSGRGMAFAAGYLLSGLKWLLTRGRRYDLVQAFFIYLDAVELAALSPFSPWRLVVRTSGAGDSGDLARLRRIHCWQAFRRLEGNVDQFVVQSNDTLEELRQSSIGDSRTTLIPNGVDTDEFVPASRRESDDLRASLGLPGDRDVVVSVARLSPEKGIDVVLKGWESLMATSGKRGRGTLLVIVGDGPARNEYAAQIDVMGLQDSVVFTGASTRVEDYLRAADLFVLASRAEGFSNALLEAMACGLPCVATRTSGSTDAIRPGVNGLLVSSEDPGGLAAAIEALLQNPQGAREMGVAARSTAEDRFSLDRVVDQYEELYNRLCA